ncbi:MAG TPA: AtzE family amidohydrolase [Candidatus Deferrimicrobiaceae bacterium]|nr:AtzE family amidohydrolase [Candidatus Deferrimicrobiaceae bacterium]
MGAADYLAADGLGLAAAVRAGRVSARAVTEAALGRISARGPAVNAFTTVLAEQARADADRVDRAIASGRDAGPLAGLPFAVKDLFDVAGITTLAGSKINRERPPAARDAVAVAALRRAGAVLVGALNMDEYAYGFTTENSHYGPVRNPHDATRVAGGSSGGSGAAVGAGLVPLTLGSDTNGSVRVPASLCGVFGLKPTYGRVSRTGTTLFAGSFDHVGALGRSVRDVTAALDVMQGPDPQDPVCTTRPLEPCLPLLGEGIDGLRIGVLDGHFARGGEPEVFAAVARVAAALGASRRVTIPEAHRARAAAMVITASEGANAHLADLKRRPHDFDPLTRDRFLAGALVPAAAYVQAQRFRAWYRARVAELFGEVDVLLAPTTPCPAPRIGQDRIVLDGVEVLTRPNLGVYTQPLSFIGLPVLSAPVTRPGALPLGVQIVGAPFREAHVLRVGALLEAKGVVAAAVSA